MFAATFYFPRHKVSIKAGHKRQLFDHVFIDRFCRYSIIDKLPECRDRLSLLEFVLSLINSIIVNEI
jgi:hypothetical protein